MQEAILRAWIVNLGRRDARERLAHLFCELHLRMRHVERVEEDRFEFPLTQIEIADALALTPVHTNRMIQRLRKDGLIELRRQTLTILDLRGLRALAGLIRTMRNAGRSLGTADPVQQSVGRPRALSTGGGPLLVDDSHAQSSPRGRSQAQRITPDRDFA